MNPEPRTLFIRMSEYKKEDFTPEERDKLNAAIVSQVICPRGGVIDLGKLPAPLAKRVEAMFGREA